ncbi:hypothetical protein TREES_T100008555 [Tupaia chinensis]|uniref:Uncharacterized protein n=1 Tax=Tupaia chinensis TaxID=246437 RepID=L9L9Q6_TUPCH|nr:hypothetical protein TREES_T100008555 [Tupaia chinensis]
MLHREQGPGVGPQGSRWPLGQAGWLGPLPPDRLTTEAHLAQALWPHPCETPAAQWLRRARLEYLFRGDTSHWSQGRPCSRSASSGLRASAEALFVFRVPRSKFCSDVEPGTCGSESWGLACPALSLWPPALTASEPVAAALPRGCFCGYPLVSVVPSPASFWGTAALWGHKPWSGW